MSNGTTTWAYTYDDAGLRTQRTDGEKIYSYGYSGGQLRTMTVSSGSSTDYYTFRYGPDGHPYSVRVNATDYFYLTNLQGDMTGIRDKNGATVVSYTYDAWGNIVSTLGSKASTLGEANPLRYRSYVYDQETELYYLQSRYYNPEWGRFINADGLLDTSNLVGINLFAYSFNNPVNLTDSAGNWPSWNTMLKATAIVATAVVLAVAVAATVVTFGATSIAATIVITSTITIAAKGLEVAVLQGRKSASEGKDTSQVTEDIIDSVFDNGVGTIAKTAAPKAVGYAAGFYSQSSSFQDVMELQKIDGNNLKTLAGATTYEIANRFTNLKSCVSATASKGSMLLSYGFAALNVASTVYSVFVDDPVQYAALRGYTLR